MIVNESDGTKQADEKWTDIIDGMRILTQEQLTQYLQDAGFSKITAHVNRKQHWLCSPGGESTVDRSADSKCGFIAIVI